MLDVFSPLSTEAQRASRDAYREFLIERDGPADLENRILARREERMARYVHPLPRLREIDRALFLSQYRKFDPRGTMSREALLLMALVRINGAEAYAVDEHFDTAYQRALRSHHEHDDIDVLLHIEETYHTRILLSSAVLYGLDITEPYVPPLSLRALIGSITRGPDVLSRPLILAGEIVGTVTFLNLLHATRDILRHDPELRDAIEERLTEVLIDEIGHISFNRMLLGPAGLLRARLLLPLVAAGSAATVPVLRAIGLRTLADDATTVTTSARLPEAVRRAAFVA
jgi:hypothetical protein